MATEPPDDHGANIDEEFQKKMEELLKANLQLENEPVEEIKKALDPDEIQKLSVPEGEAEATIEEIDREFQEKMAALNARADSFKQTQESKKQAAQKAMKEDQDSSKGLAVGLAVAYTLIGVPLFFIGAGYLLDNAMKTHFFVNWGALIGSVGGLAAAIVILNRQN